jgi:diaminobutyrate-2-oxoglutarate transaminase
LQASELSSAAFGLGVILETSGPKDEVAKLMPPLTIEDEVLVQGLERIEVALHSMLGAGEHTSKLSANM